MALWQWKCYRFYYRWYQSDCFKIIPPPTREEKLASSRKGMKYAAHGITSIQNASGTVQEFLLYETLLKTNELTLRSTTAFIAGKKNNRRIYTAVYKGKKPHG